MSRSFPLALHLEAKACLLVGSSVEGAERARALVEAGARLEIVGKAPCAALAAVVTECGLVHRERDFLASDLDGKWLAVLVERDLDLGRTMAALCDERRVLFCATDQPQNNSFSHMAVAKAGLVSVAISSEGRAPALARRLRQEFERVLHDAQLAEFVAEHAALREATPPAERRETLSAHAARVRFEGKLAIDRSNKA